MIQLSSSDRETLKAWNSSQSRPVTLNCFSTDHKQAQKFEAFIQQLEPLASNLVFKTKLLDENKGENKLPCFSPAPNIRFCALPLEKELAPFLYAIDQVGSNQIPDQDIDLEKLETIDIPVNLKLYIALACPHCPNMVTTTVKLAAACNLIQLEIIDGTLFPDEAAKDQVMSAPTLILDKNFRWTQNASAQEIIDMIVQRDPSLLGVSTLRTILEDGKASWLTQQMVAADAIFDAFISLLLHETWSVRLGAMVVVEELASKAPELACTLCPKLMAVFGTQETPVQGDILYALGETGDLETIQWIEAQRPELEHPDLIEAAADAIEAIRERNKA